MPRLCAIVFAAAAVTSVAAYNKPHNGPATNCQATTAFNKTALGLTMVSEDVYTCDGDICWQTQAPFDTGDTAWMLFATTFVMLQTPATGFAQGGLVRRKNTLSVIGQSFAGVIIGCLQWYVWGYSLTFGESRGDGFIGSPSTFPYFENVDAYDCIEGQTIPHMLFAAFQMTFALMVPVLITGAWAEKFHFWSACLFMVIWPVLVYYPTAHWIWGGGWLAEEGVVDYAGGIVIHTSSGVASLVVAVMLQKRRAFKKGSDEYTHNIPMTLIGVALVWVGWYSFNGGSGLRANGQAISALLTTQIAACTSAAVWCVCSWLDDHTVAVTHLASGALAGLAGITPGSGYVAHIAAVPIGAIVGLCSFYGGKYIKNRLNLDDVLDVTSLQAIPGAIGSILVGFFATDQVQPCELPEFPGKPCNPADINGVFYHGGSHLLKWQIAAVVCQIVWTAVFTYITMLIIKFVYHIDVPAEFEEIGLDRAEHGEKAYDLDFEDSEDEEILAAKLCSAAATGNLKDIMHIIRMGCNANVTDVDGRSPLHLAARHGHLQVCEYLVENCGLKFDVKDNFGNTPFRDAMRAGQELVIAWLQENGATIENDGHDNTALLLDAASNGHIEHLKSLLAAGVDVDSVDYDGRTALHLAACSNQVAAVALLLKNNASTTMTDRFGGLAVQDAQRYHYNEVESLIKESAAEHNINFDELINTSKSGSTADHVHDHDSTATRELLQAAKIGDLADIKRLRVKRANLLAGDYDGRTALHLAAGGGHLDCVRYLMTIRGQNVNVQDKFHNTPLSDANKGKHTTVVEFLKASGAHTINNSVGTALCKLAHAGDLKGLEEQHNNGVDFNTADYDGRTALHLAAAAGHMKLFTWLVQCGADINATDRWGGTPLEDAIKQNQVEAAKLLMRMGAAELQHSKVVVATDLDHHEVAPVIKSDYLDVGPASKGMHPHSTALSSVV